MPESTTAIRESRDIQVEGVDRLSASDRPPRGRVSVGGLLAHYRLRCIALETTVAALEAELDRTERHMQEMRARYEDILQRREHGDEVTYTRPE